ncbi:unnamed protein product, partial [Nesidiocoris tenuis]
MVNVWLECYSNGLIRLRIILTAETGERVKDLEREQIAIEEELERVRKEKEE